MSNPRTHVLGFGGPQDVVVGTQLRTPVVPVGQTWILKWVGWGSTASVGAQEQAALVYHNGAGNQDYFVDSITLNISSQGTGKAVYIVAEAGDWFALNFYTSQSAVTCGFFGAKLNT